MTTRAPFDGAMTTHLDRIARVTSIIRTRDQDAAREVAHGGTPSELTKRVARAAVQLKRIADEMEKAIA